MVVEGGGGVLREPTLAFIRSRKQFFGQTPNLNDLKLARVALLEAVTYLEGH